MLQDFRVAVVGSGPAGIYAAAALAGHEGAAVDVIDRLPTPFGLVRDGVAPDHEKMKSVAVVLRKVLEHERLRFLGNVELGADVSVADLHRHYDVIVVASGAAVDRRLGIGGEDLPGSFSATEFVSWYSGHRDTAPDLFWWAQLGSNHRPSLVRRNKIRIAPSPNGRVMDLNCGNPAGRCPGVPGKVCTAVPASGSRTNKRLPADGSGHRCSQRNRRYFRVGSSASTSRRATLRR